MKSFKKYIAVLVAAAGLVAPMNAQEFRTSYFMKTSNLRHQMNPAFLDTPYISFLIGGINVGARGNMGVADFIYPYNKNGYEYTTFMNPDIDANQFLDGLYKNNVTSAHINMNLLSVGFRAFHGVNLIELNLRSSTNVRLPYEFFEFAKLAGQKEHYQLHNIGARSQNYVELALAHSHKIGDNLTVGGKVKFLFGAAYADLNAKQLDLTLTGDQWRVQGDVQMKASLMDTQLIYLTEYNEVTGKEEIVKDKYGNPRIDGIDDFKASAPSFGLAFDFGAQYQVLDNLNVSAAITDLGYIGWRNTHHTSSTGDYLFDGFDNIYITGGEEGEEHSNSLDNQLERMGDELEEMFMLYDKGSSKHAKSLAATLNLGAEYTMPFYDKLSVGLLYTSRIAGIHSWHQGMLSAIVHPAKWFEATVNTSVSTTGWAWGAALSFKAPHFNFYLGSDAFLGKVSKQFIPLHNTNANVVLGFTFPLK